MEPTAAQGPEGVMRVLGVGRIAEEVDPVARGDYHELMFARNSTAGPRRRTTPPLRGLPWPTIDSSGQPRPATA